MFFFFFNSLFLSLWLSLSLKTHPFLCKPTPTASHCWLPPLKTKINKTTRQHHHSYNNCHCHRHPQPWPPTTKIITKSQTQTHNLITIHHQQPEKEKEKQPSKIITKSQTHNLITTNNWKRKKKNNHRETHRLETHSELLADDPRRSTLNADAHASQIQTAKSITHTTTAESTIKSQTKKEKKKPLR